MKRNYLILLCSLWAAIALMLAACASVGRPEGGPKDELPPVCSHSNPSPGALNFSDNKLSIFFDENIKVEDVMNKVVVSPVQKTPPRVIANGKKLSVELQDSLIPDATYTIDFSDAIRDLNEGNILDGFAFDFSTGPTRDSLVISGMLFEAATLEPAQGVIVGVYSNLADSAVRTLPLERIAKTNQYGQFVIRNLAEGSYNIFAINDLNRDYHWDRTEDVAFYDIPIVPTVEKIQVTDTLRASDGQDSVVIRDGVRYLPNDVLLTWFNENYKSQYLRNYTRLDSTKIQLEFGAPSDTLPILTLINTPLAGSRLSDNAVLDHSGLRDTLTYWLRDRRLVSSDTIILEARYLKTDSTDHLSWTTDTLKLINKDKPKPAKKKKAKEPADSIAADSVPSTVFMTFNANSRGDKDVHTPLLFTASQPIDTIIPSGIHLDVLRDTVWTPVAFEPLRRDSVNRLLTYALHHPWEPGAKYRFTADSAAIAGIYGIHTNAATTEFKVKELDEYSSIGFNLSGFDPADHIVVQLLNSSDTPVATQPAVNGTVKFQYLTPATYYARAFIDDNDNGLWDTGKLTDKIQPEAVFYYPKKINLKKNWDILQPWNLTETPLDLQKPNDIKKNKPKTKDADKARTDDEDDEEEDSFYSPRGGQSGSGFGNQRGSGRRGGGGLKSSRDQL